MDQQFENLDQNTSALQDSQFYSSYEEERDPAVADISIISPYDITRPSLPLTAESVDIDDLNSVQDLHQLFATKMLKMEARLKVFELMEDWMVCLEKALSLNRYADSGLSESTYLRLQEILQKEYETWDLIKNLYFGRLSTESDDILPFSEAIPDRYHTDEMTYVDKIVLGSKALREMQNVISWLELNYSRKPEPETTYKDIAWEQTFEVLKKNVLLDQNNPSLVSSIDPDVLTREEKQLHPLDADEELRIHRGTFYYIRIGEIEKALAYLHESGHIAKATALLGSCFSQREPIIRDDNSEMISQYPAITGYSEYPADSGLQPKPFPDFIITGNPLRDLWKSVAWSICEDKYINKWEKAVIGACCGHRKSLLDVANGFEDQLWAYIKTSFHANVEHYLRKLNVGGTFESLPLEYSDQNLTIAEIIDIIRKSEDREEFTVLQMMKFLQQCVIKNDVQEFLTILQGNFEALLNDAEEQLIVEHVVRFVVHILLIFAIVDLGYVEDLLNVACEIYIGILNKTGLLTHVPFYAQKLTPCVQISVIVNQISCDKAYSTDDIFSFLKAASENDLDVLQIGLAVVDKLRTNQDDFDVTGLNWISSCYSLVKSPQLVIAEFLRYTVLISRKYLTLGNLEKVKQLIKQVDQQFLKEVEDDCPEIVREFVCYREYLEAEDALQEWKRAKSQKPSLDFFLDPPVGSLADRVIWDKKRKEFEVTHEKWSKSTEFYAKIAIKSFMHILKFPDGGWLRNCYNNANETEVLHICAVRKFVLKQVIFVLLSLINESGAADTFKELCFVLCDSRRKILEELTPSEISNIFKIIEQFTRKKSPNLMVLPK